MVDLRLAEHNSLFIGKVGERIENSAKLYNILKSEMKAHLPHDKEHFLNDCGRKIIEYLMEECLYVSNREIEEQGE